MRVFFFGGVVISNVSFSHRENGKNIKAHTQAHTNRQTHATTALLTGYTTASGDKAT